MFSGFFGKKKHEHTSSHRRHGHTSSHHNRESPYKDYFEVEENKKMVKYRREGGRKMEESYSELDHNSGKMHVVTKKYDEKGKLYQINKKKRNDTNTGFTHTEDTIKDDGKHTRTITKYDKEGRGLEQLTLEGTKRDGDFNEDFEKGEFQGPTDITYRNNKTHVETKYERDLDRGYPRTKKIRHGEPHGDFLKEQDKELFTDSLFGKDHGRQAGMTPEEKDAQREGQAYRQRLYDAKDREKEKRKKLHGKKHQTGRKDKEVRQEIRGNEPDQSSTTGPLDPKEAVVKETAGNVEEDIEEEDKPKGRIRTKEKRRKMYHSGVGKRETLLHDKDKYTGKGGGDYRQREEEGEFTHQKPSSDFKHSKFKGTNDHKKSPTEFSRREEHVSDTDKRFLNTDKDYKVKTNPTHIEGPVTEEKRGTKVRVEKEGSIGDKTLSKFNPGVSKGKTDLYDDKTGKHLQKTTFEDRDEYHEIHPDGTKTTISQEKFENEENAFKNTPSYLDKDPQHPTSLTTLPKPTTTESFAEFEKEENMDIPTSSEEGDLTSFNTESQVVGKAEQNASKYESAMKETESLYDEL